MADHELVYQERVLKITDDLQELNIVDGSELDLQGTLKLQKPKEENHKNISIPKIKKIIQSKMIS